MPRSRESDGADPFPVGWAPPNDHSPVGGAHLAGERRDSILLGFFSKGVRRMRCRTPGHLSRFLSGDVARNSWRIINDRGDHQDHRQPDQHIPNLPHDGSPPHIAVAKSAPPAFPAGNADDRSTLGDRLKPSSYPLSNRSVLLTKRARLPAHESRQGHAFDERADAEIGRPTRMFHENRSLLPSRFDSIATNPVRFPANPPDCSPGVTPGEHEWFSGNTS